MAKKKQLPRRSFIISSMAGLLGLAALPSLLRKEPGMLAVRKSMERGHADHGWLNSRHTFSFAEYYDPQFMGFGPLRVINEDRILGGTGFDTHPHRDMEIISYVVSGGLRHQDSMGNVAVIKPGEVQRMSAGTGVRHSEYNDEGQEPTHFFQIWIQPNKLGVAPGYGQKSFASELNNQKLVHVISPDGRNGSISIHQDANMFISRLKKSESLNYKLEKDRRLWIQVVKGSVVVNDVEITTGDAIAAKDIGSAKITASEDAEMLLFDMV